MSLEVKKGILEPIMNLKQIQKHIDPAKGALSLVVLILALTAIFFFVQASVYRGELKELRAEVETQKTQLEQTSTESQDRIKILEELIESQEEENEELEDELRKEQRKFESIEDQIKEATDIVEILDKKSKVDPELLQKYSKIYFLNEHYAPETVDAVDEAYTFGKEVLSDGKVVEFLDDLLEEAEEDGVDLRVVSGFRSFARQATLKSQYVVTYGSGANQFSADQGYSEHQLGTTFDFSTEALGDNFSSFGSTEGFEWMEDNAHKFGFVLSYPEGNEYYQYEPWHWRFVGKDLARYLDREDMYFYDADQRKIDEYTASFFDR